MDRPRENSDIQESAVIQIVPPHKWGGCIAVVREVKPWGCQAYVSIPHNDGTPPGQAFIRLNTAEFESLGALAIFAPAQREKE